MSQFFCSACSEWRPAPRIPGADPASELVIAREMHEREHKIDVFASLFTDDESTSHPDLVALNREMDEWYP